MYTNPNMIYDNINNSTLNKRLNINYTDNNIDNKCVITDIFNKNSNINNNSFNNITIKNDLSKNTLNNIGLPNKDYFIELINNKKLYGVNDFIFQNVEDDCNCGYRCISV